MHGQFPALYVELGDPRHLLRVAAIKRLLRGCGVTQQSRKGWHNEAGVVTAVFMDVEIALLPASYLPIAMLSCLRLRARRRTKAERASIHRAPARCFMFSGRNRLGTHCAAR